MSGGSGPEKITVQDVQTVKLFKPPASSSPATRGRKEVGELNGAQRLNDLNILNSGIEGAEDT
jgi:hypothetical protein